LLKRFADTVYLVLDGDAAGKRTNDILELFVAPRWTCEFSRPRRLAGRVYGRRGGEGSALLAGAIDALEHKIRTARASTWPATRTANLASKKFSQSPAACRGNARHGQFARAATALTIARQFASTKPTSASGLLSFARR
jgi:hypothetical protein